jgi:hypothetical protein
MLLALKIMFQVCFQALDGLASETGDELSGITFVYAPVAHFSGVDNRFNQNQRACRA